MGRDFNPLIHHLHQASEILSRVEDWTFDSFKLSEATSGRPLSTLAFFLFKRSGIVSLLDLPENKLATCLISIEEGYRPNPYHSRTHAADVLRNLHMMLTRGHLFDVVRINPPQQSTVAPATAGEAGSTPTQEGKATVQPPHHPDMSLQDARTLLTLYLSAVVHDYDHRGVTNAFLIQDEDPIAVRPRLRELLIVPPCISLL